MLDKAGRVSGTETMSFLLCCGVLAGHGDAQVCSDSGCWRLLVPAVVSCDTAGRAGFTGDGTNCSEVIVGRALFDVLHTCAKGHGCICTAA
jgi:hypothetical protein